jgi:DNA-binding transcriptional LysR family regulator
MEDLTYMVTFARVVKSGSFAGAARKLKVSTSVTSKHVAKLERALGVRLLNRSTRKLSLTEAGAAYYEHCARIVDEIESSKRVVAQLQATPRGMLRVTAPVTFANSRLAPVLPDFFRKHPDVQIDLSASNRVVDLAEDGFDVAIRIVRSLPPNVIARELRPVRWHLVASPAYLEHEGTPVHPAGLTRHNCLIFTTLLQNGVWHFQHDKDRVEVAVHGSLICNTVEALHDLVCAGMGITLLPGYMAGADIRSGKLKRLLPEWEIESGAHLYAVYLPTRHMAPKVRVFVDFLVERFGFDAAKGPDEDDAELVSPGAGANEDSGNRVAAAPSNPVRRRKGEQSNAS